MKIWSFAQGSFAGGISKNSQQDEVMLMKIWSFVLLTLIFSLFSASFLVSSTKSQGCDFQITWQLDSSAYNSTGDLVWLYAPRDYGVILVGLNNTGDITFKVTRIGVHFDWMKEGSYVYVEPKNEMKLQPGQSMNVGKINFQVPEQISQGYHYYSFKIDILELHGNEWVPETYYSSDWRDLRVVSSRPYVTVDFDFSNPTYTYHQGEEVESIVVLKNEGEKGVTINKINLYIGWDEEFCQCLESALHLSPGERKQLTCHFWIPKILAPGNYTSSIEAEVKLRTDNEELTIYFHPDYVIDYRVMKAESFIQKYKEMLGVITATVSAVSVIIGALKKWKTGD